MKHIVVASDSFKGSLTSREVGENVEIVVRKLFPSCKVDIVSVADGGEGTVEALVDTLGGRLVTKGVSDPLFRPVEAVYAVLQDGVTAVVEMSSASGLPLLSPQERNPMKTTTYGTGELILSAIDAGCRKFLVGIGGSATNDGGLGMLSALGFRFYDKDRKLLEGVGASLIEVAEIDDSSVPMSVLESEFIVACDVDTPFCGKEGAAYVFAPQKGADAQMVVALDEGLVNFAKCIKEKYGCDISGVAGTGAAGGLGGAFLAFLGARLQRGVDMVLDAVDFDSYVKYADLVITGEGRIDYQTVKGKTPFGVMCRARKYGVPVIAIGGAVQLDENVDTTGFKAIFPIVQGPVSLEFAMRKDVAAENVRLTVERLLRLM